MLESPSSSACDLAYRSSIPACPPFQRHRAPLSADYVQSPQPPPPLTQSRTGQLIGDMGVSLSPCGSVPTHPRHDARVAVARRGLGGSGMGLGLQICAGGVAVIRSAAERAEVPERVMASIGTSMVSGIRGWDAASHTRPVRNGVVYSQVFAQENPTNEQASQSPARDEAACPHPTRTKSALTMASTTQEYSIRGSMRPTANGSQRPASPSPSYHSRAGVNQNPSLHLTRMRQLNLPIPVRTDGALNQPGGLRERTDPH
ncbi:hypothetical protein JHW43_007838 [Diplocarpon mali]|nr:hypothetical protein JHW43_007838 [Diplocarpon mali]